jgi:LPS-assembly lipoprotein
MSRISFPAILLTLLLTGCGFQLRGQAPLPPEMRVTYVQTPSGLTPPGSISRKLPQALASNGVTITRDPTQATATITLLRETSGRRTVAADRFDILRQYFLAYDVAYRVTLANGQILIPDESMNASRTLLFDENRVLGFESAQESLIESMAEDLAWQIVRRLQAAAGS